jgi:HK97 family phage major capsid protein
MRLSDKFRAQLDEKREEAKAAYDAYEVMRKESVDSEDFTDDQFVELEGLYEKHQEIGAECNTLEAKWARAVEMEANTTDRPQTEQKLWTPETPTRVKTPGETFTESETYQNLIKSASLHSDRARIHTDPVKVLDRDAMKALITGASDTSAGIFVQPERLAGFLDLLQRPIKLIDLITVNATDSDTVEWVKMNSFTNAAAEVAEAIDQATGTKPESTMDFAVVQSPVQNIAHWMAVTRRALADAPQMRDLIDTQLRLGIDLRLEAQVLNGNGTAPNLRGILNTSGIGTQAKATDSAIVAILKAQDVIRNAYMEPNAVLMNPADWQAVRLLRDDSGAGAGTGGYLFGSPQTGGISQLWGVPVVTTPLIAAGTALVGDFKQAILWAREGVTVTASTEHADFFIKNLVAVLAEGRWALGVPRPAGFCKVTGL